MKYNFSSKLPNALGGDYRPHYRKDEVDAHLAYLAILIEAQAATINLLRVQKADIEHRMSRHLRAWFDSIEKAKRQ